MQEPVVFPDIGIWHPAAPCMYEDVKEFLNWNDTRKDIKFAKDAPVIGLVLQRTHLVTGDEGHYTSVVQVRNPPTPHTPSLLPCPGRCTTPQRKLMLFPSASMDSTESI